MPICKISIWADKPKPTSYPKAIHTIADALKAKRYDLNLTQIELAEKMNVPQYNISSWEQGNNKKPVPKMMKKIIDFLGYVPPLGIEKNTLGYELYKYRCIHGLTQRQIALMLKMGWSAVTLIESNKKVDTMYTEKIQNFLNSQNSCVSINLLKI